MHRAGMHTCMHEHKSTCMRNSGENEHFSHDDFIREHADYATHSNFLDQFTHTQV